MEFTSVGHVARPRRLLKVASVVRCFEATGASLLALQETPGTIAGYWHLDLFEKTLYKSVAPLGLACVGVPVGGESAHFLYDPQRFEEG